MGVKKHHTYEDLIELCEAQQWRVVKSRLGVVAYAPNGVDIVTIHQPPGRNAEGPGHMLDNVRSRLRRAGLIFPDEQRKKEARQPEETAMQVKTNSPPPPNTNEAPAVSSHTMHLPGITSGDPFVRLNSKLQQIMELADSAEADVKEIRALAAKLDKLKDLKELLGSF